MVLLKSSLDVRYYTKSMYMPNYKCESDRKAKREMQEDKQFTEEMSRERDALEVEIEGHGVGLRTLQRENVLSKRVPDIMVGDGHTHCTPVNSCACPQC